MAIYTAPRAVLPIFNPSDFGIVLTTTTTTSKTYEEWLNAFTFLNMELTDLANLLLNIGTQFTYTQGYSVSAGNGASATMGQIAPMTVTGTSPFPMPFFAFGTYIYTNDTNVNAQIGWQSNNNNIFSNVHGNVNTRYYGNMLAGSFTYSTGASIYIYQTYGGNSITAYPAYVGVLNIVYVFIK